MKKKHIVLITILVSYMSSAQVGIGTLVPNSSSQLDIVADNKGILIPRVSLKSTTDNSTITNGNINSMLVFNTVTIADITPGFYYWYTDKWERIGSGGTIAATTNTLTYLNNNITSTVNRESASVQLVNSIYNSLDGSGLVTAVNGVQSNALDLSPIIKNAITASNGITFTDNKLELGGWLTKPTMITTSAVNYLSFSGLQKGNSSYLYDGNKYSSTSDLILVSDPITGILKQVKSTMPKFFYSPSIIVPTHNAMGLVLAGEQTLNAYSLYTKQFGFKESSGQARSSITSELPILAPDDLDYFVTYFDTDVFEKVSISTSGVIMYTIKSTAVITEASFMNIVFKVKD